MKKIETKLPGVYIVEPQVFGDHRGWFTETYNKQKFKNLGINNDFVQDNHSFSAQKGTLRGIHFQIGESAQAKLVRCSKGAVLDVAVDLRADSPTYKQWVAVELTKENKRQLYIPRGFGHGFLTLTEDCEFQYKVDNYYDSSADRSIIWNDIELSIDWGISDPILSDKDKEAPTLKQLGKVF